MKKQKGGEASSDWALERRRGVSSRVMGGGKVGGELRLVGWPRLSPRGDLHLNLN
jgi:hypothetical protein